ncbi:MAG: 50S ribosomal protein L17, partial [Candidatus Omnitrophota bacterium]
MRHRKNKGRLSRRTSWRKATLKSLANDLFTYQRIETTRAKARALRSFAEPLITLAKNGTDSVAARRQAFKKLCDKKVVKILFDELGPLYKDIPGGYTRIIPFGTRKG